MFKNINCVWADNPGGYCKNKLIKRSLFGIGARCCVKYYDDNKKCKYLSPHVKPIQPPAGSHRYPTSNNIIKSDIICDYCNRSVGVKVACSFSVSNFSCFRGQQLYIKWILNYTQ